MSKYLCGLDIGGTFTDCVDRRRRRAGGEREGALDMRHKGQIHEVEVGLDEMPVGEGELERLPERFTSLYERLYGSGSSLSRARVSRS